MITNRIRKNVLVSTDHGSMIVNRFDYNSTNTGHGIWLLDHGNADTIEADICIRSLKNKKNPVIFDVGANIGTITSWLAQVFPLGTIYAFEPQRLVFQILCGNIAINNWDNCYLYNIGLGDSNKIIKIEEPDYFQSEDFGTFSLIEDKIKTRSGRTSFVEIMTIDEFCKKFFVNSLDYLKIDAEGMDLEVLIGGVNTIKKYQPYIFVEHCDTIISKKDELTEFLTTLSYQCSIIKNNILAVPFNDPMPDFKEYM